MRDSSWGDVIKGKSTILLIPKAFIYRIKVVSSLRLISGTEASGNNAKASSVHNLKQYPAKLSTYNYNFTFNSPRSSCSLFGTLLTYGNNI